MRRGVESGAREMPAWRQEVDFNAPAFRAMSRALLAFRSTGAMNAAAAA